MASDRPTCVLYVASDSAHLKQVYTGFAMLARRGVLTLRQEFEGPDFRARSGVPWSGAEAPPTLVAEINGKRICYNTADAGTIDLKLLASVDFYFKRSFDPDYVRDRIPGTERSKVRPLGLNYAVESAGFDRYRIERSRLHRKAGRFRMALKGMAIDRLMPWLSAPERLTFLEGLPSTDANPRVLFVSRLWDPDSVPDQSQRDVVRQINARRALCVRALRKEFGVLFTGGLLREPLAEREHNDLLLPPEHSSAKLAYLRQLPAHPICVATTGLNRSIQWKLGEYVAFSRSIVSEKLHYEVPGNFSPGANYLEFETPDELVTAVTTLVDNRSRRNQMMERNREYYLRYVRPDALVLNSLVTAGIELPSGKDAR